MVFFGGEKTSLFLDAAIFFVKKAPNPGTITQL